MHEQIRYLPFLRNQIALGAARIHGMGMRHLAMPTVQVQAAGRITDDGAVD